MFQAIPKTAILNYLYPYPNVILTTRKRENYNMCDVVDAVEC